MSKIAKNCCWLSNFFFSVYFENGYLLERHFWNEVAKSKRIFVVIELMDCWQLAATCYYSATVQVYSIVYFKVVNLLTVFHGCPVFSAYSIVNVIDAGISKEKTNSFCARPHVPVNQPVLRHVWRLSRSRDDKRWNNWKQLGFCFLFSSYRTTLLC